MNVIDKDYSCKSEDLYTQNQDKQITVNTENPTDRDIKENKKSTPLQQNIFPQTKQIQTSAKKTEKNIINEVTNSLFPFPEFSLVKSHIDLSSVSFAIEPEAASDIPSGQFKKHL